MSYKLDSFFGKDAEKAEHTASIRPASGPIPAPAMPADIDLAYTKAAVAALLGQPDKNASQPWENPTTGARGTVTATADAYTSDGFQCRDFLASYIRDGAESWLQGDACRIHQGKWTVRSLRPLKRT
ncbi:MAG: RT0821/Lpp0805 family surface protein [Xanthobacteraceae bacterium]